MRSVSFRVAGLLDLVDMASISPRAAVLAVLLQLMVALSVDAGPLMPSRLRVEYMDRPLGIDIAQPRFSWALEHTDRAEKQTAYQLTVMAWKPSTTGGLKAVNESLHWAARQSVGTNGFVALMEGSSLARVHWRSGWMESSQSTNVPYSGTPALVSDTLYVWSVSFRDSKGVESPAASSMFSTGLMSATDWSGASWLDGEQGNQLRVEFNINPKVDLYSASADSPVSNIVGRLN